MKYILSVFIFVYSLLMLVVLSGCSNGNDVAGTGSSTGNAKIVGTILSEDGTPAAQSIVYLIPEDYNPVLDIDSIEIDVDTADSEGRYSFDLEDTLSVFNIDAKGISGNFRYYKSSLSPIYGNSDIDTGYLKEAGVLKVILPYDSFDSSTGYLYIPGTRVASKVAEFTHSDELNYTIVIDSVPAAIYSSLQYNETDTVVTDNPIIDSQFVVNESDTSTIGEYQVLPVYIPGVFGVVQYGQMNISNAIVKLVPSDYDPVTGGKIADSLIDTTNANGEFSIRYNDTTKIYNLIISDSKDSLGLIVDSLTVSHDSLNLVSYKIGETGYLHIHLQDSDIDTAAGYLFLPGTDISVDLSNYSSFDQVNYSYLISSVKIGSYQNVINADDMGGNNIVIFDIPFSVTENDTTVLGIKDPLIFNFSSSNSGLPSDNVYSVGADPYGGIWFGTHMGEFIRYTPNDTSKQWYVSEAADYGVYSSILSIATDLSDGTMWFGTHGAVFSLTKSTPTVQSKLSVYDPVTSFFPGGSVYSIAVDRSNVKWFGSYTYGVVSFDGYSWTNYPVGPNLLPSAYVYDIAVDSNNTKWVSSRGGVSSYDGASWITYNKANSNLICDTVFCVDINKNGTVWAGFYDGSAASFDGVNWTVYTPGNSTLSGDAVNSVAVDLNGVTWLGTDNGHLISFDGTTWKDYSSYIPNNTDRLLDIEIDSKNNKWVTTETAGVVLVDSSVK